MRWYFLSLLLLFGQIPCGLLSIYISLIGPIILPVLHAITLFQWHSANQAIHKDKHSSDLLCNPPSLHDVCRATRTSSSLNAIEARVHRSSNSRIRAKIAYGI
ncbi:hypothetical protein GGR56DRAFT_163895 [Xylariaceae sp. FL0804]|nr:hypothetical protein GGR56DRAFT_163895 [Xylariaceae sp. FL0804]